MSHDKPLIGLVGGRFTGGRIAGNLEVLAASPIDVYYADYSQSVLAAGGLPVWIPIDTDPAEIVPRLDGLLMTGGTDIDPARYGAEPVDEVLELVPARDDYELRVLDAAAEHALPTLGICRGLQIINVHAGGTLHQHVPEHAFTYDGLSHDIECAPGSVLAGCYGEHHRVNSLHHQSVDAVGAKLSVTATAPDGGVEGLEHAELPMVAVQWHPEMLPTRASDPIFAWLVDRAR